MDLRILPFSTPTVSFDKTQISPKASLLLFRYRIDFAKFDGPCHRFADIARHLSHTFRYEKPNDVSASFIHVSVLFIMVLKKNARCDYSLKTTSENFNNDNYIGKKLRFIFRHNVIYIYTHTQGVQKSKYSVHGYYSIHENCKHKT